MTDDAGRLPPLVRRYLERVLPEGATIPPTVRLRQSGELRLRPGGRWSRFDATHEAATHEIRLEWRARVRMLPLLTLGVRDRYADGRGEGEIRLFDALPVARSFGPEVDQGALLRYLAELPWAPQAMIANRSLAWRTLDDSTVEATAAVPGGRQLALYLCFDAEGDVERVRAPERPHKEGGAYVPRGWGGTYREYATFGAVRVPTHAEVEWELPAGTFTWFRCTVRPA